jgi:hypothetical protein
MYSAKVQLIQPSKKRAAWENATETGRKKFANTKSKDAGIRKIQ